MKWFTIIRNVLTFTVFLIVFILGLLIFLSGKSDIYGWRLLIVKSGSMEPTIKTGALIFVKKESTYAKDDVITFGPVTRPDMLVTHRIVEVLDLDGKQFVKTKGDFNAAADLDLVPIDSIIAKYYYNVPYLGYLVSFAQTQLGVVLLIIIPGTILIYDELMNLKKAVVGLYKKMVSKPNATDSEQSA